MRKFWNVVAVMSVIALVGPAFGFGTVRVAGQNAEHERITRRALGCAGASIPQCFETKTLIELAGAKNDFGAVGIPDRGDLIPENKAHCDSGDFLDIPGYPQTRNQARANLEACRSWMRKKMDEAVHDARDLVDGRGNVIKSESGIPCVFIGQSKGRAKCNVLEDLGILLHASQDFYSHTNWTDIADNSAPVGVENPPGLGRSGRAPWLDLRRDIPFPDGLLSGCFENLPESSHCNYGPKKSLHRVKHAVVNKDEGSIDPVIGLGTTKRGAVNNNFQHAVEAAVDDTQDKWAMFQERLRETYGQASGPLMACIVSHDNPRRDCRAPE